MHRFHTSHIFCRTHKVLSTWLGVVDYLESVTNVRLVSTRFQYVGRLLMAGTASPVCNVAADGPRANC